MSASTQLEVSKTAERVGRPVLRWVLAAVVGLGLVGGLAFIAVAWRHPTAFPSYGGQSTRVGHWHVGTAAYVVVTDPGEVDGSVVVQGASPDGVTDSTHAGFGYYICTLRRGPALDGIWTPSAIRHSCRNLVPAVDATLGLPRQQLLVAVTPHRRGVVVFHGLDLRYARGWRTGTQLIGGDVRISVNRSS